MMKKVTFLSCCRRAVVPADRHFRPCVTRPRSDSSTSYTRIADSNTFTPVLSVSDISARSFSFMSLTLSVMKQHLPKRLRSILLAYLSLIGGYTLYSGNIAAADTLSSGSMNTLTDYATEFVLNDNCMRTNYNESTYTLDYYNGSATVETSQSGSVDMHNYQDLCYSGISGGAIRYLADNAFLYDNGSVSFIENSSTSGGAIYRDEIELRHNENLWFSKNSATGNDWYHGCGGAIRGRVTTVRSNTVVKFSENTAGAGGAIYGGSDSTIILEGNGTVMFHDNMATGDGGAIDSEQYGSILLTGNGHVEFIGNKASSDFNPYGGAIYAFGGGNLSIQNNESVLFEKNVEVKGTNYRLRSIYAHSEVSLSSAAEKSIEFRDSVYISSSASLKLNEKYGEIEQKGDIIFSGKYTGSHLNEILEADNAGRSATAEEIQNSCTSEINGTATLYGGTLRVEDAAVLKLNGGLTVAEVSYAAVKVRAAEVNTGSHALEIVSGSSLSLADGAKLSTTELTITTGATLEVRGYVSTAQQTEKVEALTLSGAMVTGFDISRVVNTGSVSALEGDLTLENGSRLFFEDAYLELTGDLIFDIAAGDEKIELDIAPGILTDTGSQVVLFDVGGVVTFTFDGLTASAEDGLVYRMHAMDYFFGSRLSDTTELVYDSANHVVYLENAVSAAVPETTTATLSLLALTALSARRRRK